MAKKNRRTLGIRELAFATGLCGTLLIAGAGSALAHAEHGHPARIHEGACDDLGKAVFRLNSVGASIDEANAPIATPTAVNPDTAFQVMVSETTIDGPLETVITAPHAVMIYESDDEMDAIACGNVGGAMLDGSLITALGEIGVPGHDGFALFQPNGEGTNVTILLGHGLTAVSAGSSDQTNASANQNGEHQEGDADAHDNQGDEDGHGVEATPEA